MFNRELTEEEKLQLQNAISDYIAACIKKRDFMDNLMMKTTLVRPGDFIYYADPDQSIFVIIGLVCALERPASTRQAWALDNSVQCNYKYTATRPRPWLHLDEVVYEHPGVQMYSTADIDMTHVCHRAQVLTLCSEERVLEMEKVWLERNAWAHTVIFNLRRDFHKNFGHLV